MRMPSKVTTYKKSTIANFPIILEQGAMLPEKLYLKTSKNFENVSEFVEVLDCLFILGKIEVQEESGVLHFVKES